MLIDLYNWEIQLISICLLMNRNMIIKNYLIFLLNKNEICSFSPSWLLDLAGDVISREQQIKNRKIVNDMKNQGHLLHTNVACEAEKTRLLIIRNKACSATCIRRLLNKCAQGLLHLKSDFWFQLRLCNFRYTSVILR